MERDFLGMKSEIGSRSQDAAASLSSAVQWPFANKASAMHQFMSYKIAEEERQKKYFVNPGLQAAPTKDVFEARGKKFPTTASQKFTRNIAHQLPIHAYHQSQRSGNLGASACQLNEAKAFPVISHHADPVVMSSSYFKLHGNQSSPNNVVASMKQQAYGGVTTNTQIVGSMTGGLAFSRMPKLMPATAQLTIFYAGSVNVFDDVSLEKAQEIISLASKGSLVLPSSSRSEAATQAAIPVPMKVAPSDGLITKKTINPAPRSPCSGLSSTKSVSSHKRPNSRSSCSTTDDAAGDKTVSPLAKINHDEPLTTATEALGTANTTGATPRAVPQARKASLARFLERRKYRAISVMPYSCSKKITDTDTTFENGTSISPADGDLSSSRENFWYLGHAKSNITMGEPPSTKLEM